MFFIFQKSSAQPRILMDINFDFAKPMGNFKGYRPAIGYSPLNESYGINFGLGFSANFKYALGKEKKSRLVSGLTIHRFLTSSYSKDPYASNYNTDVFIFSFSAGFEYSVRPSKTVNPYFGLGVSLNTINASSYWDTISVSGKTSLRGGILGDAGVDIKVNKSGGIIIGAKVHYANLIGKTSDPSTLSSKEVPPNDAAYSYNGKNYEAINMLYFRFYFGYRFTLSK